MIRRPPKFPLFPYTTLSRSLLQALRRHREAHPQEARRAVCRPRPALPPQARLRRAHGQVVPGADLREALQDRKSTRLNSSHANISYAVFCLKKKKLQLDVTQ